jgi:hypothetical protein
MIASGFSGATRNTNDGRSAMTSNVPPIRDWPRLLVEAAAIVMSYETGVTLRQLFYRLIVAKLLENTIAAYKALSKKTAAARRKRNFPDLLDRTRVIHRYRTWDSPDAARAWLASVYRRDRTEGQAVSLYLGVEKHGLVEQLEAWFGDLGVPILALGGYSSQTYVDDIVGDVSAQGRPAILIYAGDFDPSGEDIPRDLVARAGCFAEVRRVALSSDQVEAYGLPPQMGKATDSRAAGFVRRHGRLVQVELDALPPDVLQGLFSDAIAEYWDEGAYGAAVAGEAEERAVLERAAS